MQKRTLKVTLLAILALILVLGFSGTALADQTWPDLPDTVTAKYGITDNQVAAISDGYLDGLWRPYETISRQHFAKMAVEAFNIPLKNPATPSFSDVPTSNNFYEYIEGAKAAGIINGKTATTFNPTDGITRVQAVAIVSRWIAQVNGYDLAGMYTADEVAFYLSNFGDADSIPANLRNEVAFAYDFGITEGDAYGNFDPSRLLIRIQAAAFLIRATEKVPPAEPTASNIEVVSGDKGENLIGQPHTVTFKVTDAQGHPAVGILVDFDTLYSQPYAVGNISPQAAVTDSFGQVKVNLLSHHPGTEVVTATVRTVDGSLATVAVTKYWLALDEVYILDEDRVAQNNINTPHQWCARVIVCGPGPLSTAPSDWYNVFDPTADPADVDVTDGMDWYDDFDFALEEEIIAEGFVPRTMAGIDVEWSIINVTDDNPATVKVDETEASVGNIVSVDGAAITAAKAAVGKTDASGKSCIVINSDKIGGTRVQAVATYAGNPYPKQLLDHDVAVDPGAAEHWTDWTDQPTENATALKTWISHPDFGENSPNISPNSLSFNVGEEKTLTLTLKDASGNPVSGVDVEWTFQGVGLFKHDDDRSTDTVDIDTTDADGTARVVIKSLEPGQMIVHAKYINPKTGIATVDNANVQWYKINIVTFDDPSTVGLVDDERTTDVDESEDTQNEAVSTNPVGTSHTFDLWVYGLKLRYAIGLQGGQTPWIDADVVGDALDGVMDEKDAAYFGGILIVSIPEYDPETGLVDGEEYTDEDSGLKLGKGGITEYDFDGDGVKESAADMRLTTGIYVPLEGKGVTFTQTGGVGTISDKGIAGSIEYPEGSGNLTNYDAVTDADGHAFVTVTSDKKGDQYIGAVVDYPANPNKGTERLTATAWKIWRVENPQEPKVQVTINGELVYPGTFEEGPNPVIDSAGELNSANIKVHVLDEYNNELPDYEVVYEVVGNGTWSQGTQDAADTYRPLQVLVDKTQNQRVVVADLLSRYPATGSPLTQAGPGQPYENLIPTGTASAKFYAEVNGNMWNWELSVDGLAVLPQYDFVTYALWAGSTKLTTFTVPTNGKLFGVTALSNITDSSLIRITAEIGSYGVGENGDNDNDDNGNGDNSYDDAVVLANEVDAYTIEDLNGTRPDNSEPRADSLEDNRDNPSDKTQAEQTGVGPTGGPADPYALVTGYGGEEAYFFDVDDLTQAKSAEQGTGAKAWTLNGIDREYPHGSSVDIQLLENPFNREDVTPESDVRCIINIQVFKPANGIIKDGKPWQKFEVHKVWSSEAVVTDVELTPDEATNVVGNTHTVTAQAFSDDGPVPGTNLWFWYEIVEGPNADTEWAAGVDVTEFTYTSTEAGTDTIWVGLFSGNPENGGTFIAEDTVTKTWIDPVDITVNPAEAENIVGDTHTVEVDAIADLPDDVTMNDLYYTWTLTGANDANAADVVKEQGKTAFSYQGKATGIGVIQDQITVSVYLQADDTVALSAEPAVATKTWIMPLVSLTPSDATNILGNDHTVTATVTYPAGVTDTADGPLMYDFVVLEGDAGDEIDPNASEEDAFTYTRSETGEDTIKVTVTNDGVEVGGAEATKTWETLEAVGIEHYDAENTEWLTTALANTVGDMHLARVDEATMDALAEYDVELDNLTYKWTIDQGAGVPYVSEEVDADADVVNVNMTGSDPWTEVAYPADPDEYPEGWEDAQYLQYTKHVPSNDNEPDLISVELFNNGVSLGVSDAVEKTWVAGDPYQMVDPGWVRSVDYVTDPENLWRTDSRYNVHALEVPGGSAIFYRAKVADMYGNVLTGTIDAYPVVMETLDLTPGPTAQTPIAPDSYDTDTNGYLYWTSSETWDTAASGDAGFVTFYLAEEEASGDDGIDSEEEIASSPALYVDANYGAPYFHFKFVGTP